jgi:hypothetical protein
MFFSIALLLPAKKQQAARSCSYTGRMPYLIQDYSPFEKIPGFRSAQSGLFAGARWAAISLILASLSFAPAKAESVTASELYGCWRRDAPQKIGESRVAFDQICLRDDGTAYFISIAPEGGGDDSFEWYLITPKDRLVIDGQSCLIVPSSSHTHLFLARCLYMGAWVRQCTKMTKDGTGCASRD